MVGIKFVLPIYDRTAEDGVIISVRVKDLKTPNYNGRLDFILSNSKNNTIFFDGAVLRNLKGDSIVDIIGNINSLGSIYKFKEGNICVE